MINAIQCLLRGSQIIQSAKAQIGGQGGNNGSDRQAEIKAAEDRLYRMSTDPLSERDMEHVINPATGSPYTDAEMAIALQNAEFRQTPYNDLQQVSSHNSYDPNNHDLDIRQQFEQYGIHSFELDIHAGDPGLTNFGGDERPDGDYPVYHDSLPFLGGDESYYPLLSNGLDEIAGLPNSAPITVFVDLKGDPFSGSGQMPADFDTLLQDRLGDKLFTPAEMMARAPEATNLQEAIAMAGWPTVEELDGRVMVVLTGGDDKLFDYLSESDSAAAFIAPSPDIEINAHHEAGDSDGIDFTPDPNAIFYNSSESGADASSVIHDQGSVTRVYGFDEPNDTAQATDSNHLGTDEINPADNEWDPPAETDPFITLSEDSD